jgi:hypothetical protein
MHSKGKVQGEEKTCGRSAVHINDRPKGEGFHYTVWDRWAEGLMIEIDFSWRT